MTCPHCSIQDLLLEEDILKVLPWFRRSEYLYLSKTAQSQNFVKRMAWITYESYFVAPCTFKKYSFDCHLNGHSTVNLKFCTQFQSHSFQGFRQDLKTYWKCGNFDCAGIILLQWNFKSSLNSQILWNCLFSISAAKLCATNQHQSYPWPIYAKLSHFMNQCASGLNLAPKLAQTSQYC